MKQPPLIEWCDTCFADTERYRTTRSPKMLELGVTCKLCRTRLLRNASSKALRRAEAPLRAAAREQRRVEKMKLEAEAKATRQAVRIAAKHAPRYCPRCDAITEREVQAKGTKCLSCELRRKAVSVARQAALRAAASPRIRDRHIANPQAPCPEGHHEWNSMGYCRACLRLKNKHKRTEPEKVVSEMWKRAKGRALRDGLPFGFDQKELLPLSPDCPCCGEAYSLDNRRRYRSLDKKIPERGYVTGNVEIICHECNSLTSDAAAWRLQKVADRKKQIEESQVVN